MGSPSEFANIPDMTREMRKSIVDALDALSDWRDEIEIVNKRCLRKVLDKTSGVAHSVGWPDTATKAMRECLENASTTQMAAIDQIIEGWKKQLKSPIAPLAMPPGFAGQFPSFSAMNVSGAMPQFNPLTPWTFWMQAAQAWQRAWMPDAGPRDRSH